MSDLLHEDIVGEEEDFSFFEDPIIEDKKDEEDVQTDETVSELDVEETKAEWLSSFNESTGGSYESVEQLKSFLDEYTSLREKVAQIEANNTQTQSFDIEGLKEKLSQIKDPQEFFANDVELKKNLLLKSNPNVNGEVAGKIFDIDLEKADPVDIIVLDTLLKHKRVKGGEAGAKAYVLNKYGLDEGFNWEDLSMADETAINIAAEEAAQHIASVRESVTLPEKQDFTKLLEGLQPKQEAEFDMTPWEGKIEEVLALAKEFSVVDEDGTIYTEPIDQAFIKDSVEVINDTIKKGKIEPTPENIKTMAEEVKKAYFAEDPETIVKRVIKAKEAEWKEAMHKAVHNDTDPDKRINQPKKKATMSDAQIRKALGLI